MTYVVQKAGESQDGHTTAGLETYTMPKYAPISYVVQKARERPTKKNTTPGSRTAKQGYTKPTRENENTAGLGLVTKTGQAKPAQTGRRNHHNFSAWLRKWSQLNQ